VSLDTQTREIREIILQRIAVILQDEYEETVQEHSEEYLTACLAFKSDPRLNELRLALNRIQRGDFGRCIFCKQHIATETLRTTPTAHFCDSCANALRKRRGPQLS